MESEDRFVDLCHKGERRYDDQKFLVCKQCLNNILEAMKAKDPLKFTLLFRTYNKDFWCQHSDENTPLVMLVDDEYGEIWSEAH